MGKVKKCEIALISLFNHYVFDIRIAGVCKYSYGIIIFNSMY